jgi:hypothetical protein
VIPTIKDFKIDEIAQFRAEYYENKEENMAKN